jgi:flagellar basal body-associated protein FliL
MHHLLRNRDRSVLIGSALAIAAVAGWGGVAYTSVSSRAQVTAMSAERDAVHAKYQQLEAKAGDLAQVEGKLAAARIEYSQAVQAWAEVRARTSTAQQEAVAKRAAQVRDVSQTASIAKAEPPKRPAKNP